MEPEKVGQVIRLLRQERGLTQKALAQRLHVSDKTVSKWETGQGLPEVSLLSALSDCLGVDAKRLLEGDLRPNDFVGGNMKRTKYFICPHCGNLSLCTGEATVSCCGKVLTAQEPKKAAPDERLTVEPVEDEWFITAEHPMGKGH